MHVFAGEIARGLLGGEIFGLQGDLGTGKTEFVRGLAQALGSRDAVKSPSFTLLNLYRTTHPTIKHLIHVDLYRLDKLGTDPNTDVLEQIGLDEWFPADGRTGGRDDVVIVIEWPELLSQDLSKMRQLKFSYGELESDRLVVDEREA